MKTKTLYIGLITLTLLATSFSACGSSGSSTAVLSSSSSEATQSSISTTDSDSSASSQVAEGTQYIDVVECSSVSDDALSVIEVGDALLSKESDTRIKIVQNENGDKSVCTLSGSAQLERQP